MEVRSASAFRETFRLSETTKPCSFPWTSLPYSPSSVCTSVPLIHCPDSYLYPSSVLECTRRNTGPSRILNLFAFSVLFVLSLVGAVGLSVRGASQQGKGLCEDFASEHPENCTKATIAVTITWISVVIGMSSPLSVPYMVGLIIY